MWITSCIAPVSSDRTDTTLRDVYSEVVEGMHSASLVACGSSCANTISCAQSPLSRSYNGWSTVNDRNSNISSIRSSSYYQRNNQTFTSIRPDVRVFQKCNNSAWIWNEVNVHCVCQFFVKTSTREWSNIWISVVDTRVAVSNALIGTVYSLIPSISRIVCHHRNTIQIKIGIISSSVVFLW